MSNDQNTTVQALKSQVEDFVSQRDWQVFHTPKNLAMSVAIEAGELMEHFQWSPEAQMVQDCAAIGDEMADVMLYLLALANRLEIDLSAAVNAKLARNESRFPIGGGQFKRNQ